MKLTAYDFQPSSTSKRRRTPQGYLVVPALFARTGIQEYDGSEVGETPGQTYLVDRPAEEVFAPESVASFEGMPIAIGHPDDGITADTWRQLAVGMVRDVHREGDFLAGEIWICDADAIRQVEVYGIEELSGGYSCELVPGHGEADFIQTQIRGNHVALVPRGRCGGQCRLGDQDNRSNKTMKKTLLDSLLGALGIEKPTEQQKAAAKLALATRDEDLETPTDEGDPNKPADEDTPQNPALPAPPQNKPDVPADECDPAKPTDEDPAQQIAALQQALAAANARIAELTQAATDTAEAQTVAADAARVVPGIQMTAKDSARSIREKVILHKGIESKDGLKRMSDCEVKALYQLAKYQDGTGLGRALLGDSEKAPAGVDYNQLYGSKQ
ncbi:DUF2213 domain-containing protein [Laribacter hongkongensis]|uniref:DUF2213 domain-containing protein n=1 Tax=Laribacter hongkongensis TaxID=168471 RepID=UPI001EFEDF6F|nr:DUF2213 domain-containing protein [Laribacter hongkongensis]MCG9064708.1 DUF2213 domain-containing protein [Laribacter hongkongensis]